MTHFARLFVFHVILMILPLWTFEMLHDDALAQENKSHLTKAVPALSTIPTAIVPAAPLLLGNPNSR